MNNDRYLRVVPHRYMYIYVVVLLVVSIQLINYFRFSIINLNPYVNIHIAGGVTRCSATHSVRFVFSRPTLRASNSCVIN